LKTQKLFNKPSQTMLLDDTYAENHWAEHISRRRATQEERWRPNNWRVKKKGYQVAEKKRFSMLRSLSDMDRATKGRREKGGVLRDTQKTKKKFS